MTTSSTVAALPEVARRPVPLLDLGTRYAEIGEKLYDAILRVLKVLRSRHYILAPEVEDLVDIDDAEFTPK